MLQCGNNLTVAGSQDYSLWVSCGVGPTGVVGPVAPLVGFIASLILVFLHQFAVAILATMVSKCRKHWEGGVFMNIKRIWQTQWSGTLLRSCFEVFWGIGSSELLGVLSARLHDQGGRSFPATVSMC